MKVENLFEVHHIDHERRVTLATFSFLDSTMTWWKTYTRDLRLHNFPQIKYQNELRSTLRERYVPSYYDRELMK